MSAEAGPNRPTRPSYTRQSTGYSAEREALRARTFGDERTPDARDEAQMLVGYCVEMVAHPRRTELIKQLRRSVAASATGPTSSRLPGARLPGEEFPHVARVRVPRPEGPRSRLLPQLLDALIVFEQSMHRFLERIGAAGVNANCPSVLGDFRHAAVCGRDDRRP